MSSRPFFGPYKVIDQGDMSSSITSKVTSLTLVSILSYQFIWNGTAPIGGISIECSSDYKLDAAGNVLNPGTWTAMTVNFLGSPVQTIPVTGNSGSGVVDIALTGVPYIRAVYTPVSGVGSLDAIVAGKVA